MINEEWIKTQISASRKSHIHVTTAVATSVKELLSSSFVEKQLTSKELKEISMRLIEDMVPNTSDSDGKK